MKTWKTKDGKTILIKDMTTLHLENTIKMLERNVLESHKESINSCAGAMTSLNGEMAQYYAEQEFDSLSKSDPIAWLQNQEEYKNLKTELNKRNKMKIKFINYKWQAESNKTFTQVGDSGRAFQEMLTGVSALEPQLVILDSLIRYAKAFERRNERKLSSDTFLAESFSSCLKGIRGMTSWVGAVAMECDSTFDSKDNGVMESMFWTCCEIAGLDGNKL